MAATYLMPLATCKGRTVGQEIRGIIDYTENPQKTDGGKKGNLQVGSPGGTNPSRTSASRPLQ